MISHCTVKNLGGRTNAARNVGMYRIQIYDDAPHRLSKT